MVASKRRVSLFFSVLFRKPIPIYFVYLVELIMKKSLFMLLAASALLSPLSVQATEQSGERQDSRDVRQDTRDESRDAKQECREGVVGNADCRQDHRDSKQEGRDEARDVKY
jgi:hypothetical protein